MGHSENARNSTRAIFRSGTKAASPRKPGYPVLPTIRHAGQTTNAPMIVATVNASMNPMLPNKSTSEKWGRIEAGEGLCTLTFAYERLTRILERPKAHHSQCVLPYNAVATLQGQEAKIPNDSMEISTGATNVGMPAPVSFSVRQTGTKSHPYLPAGSG